VSEQIEEDEVMEVELSLYTSVDVLLAPGSQISSPHETR
jgi:hypothetical protein